MYNNDDMQVIISKLIYLTRDHSIIDYAIKTLTMLMKDSMLYQNNNLDTILVQPTISKLTQVSCELYAILTLRFHIEINQEEINVVRTLYELISTLKHKVIQL